MASLHTVVSPLCIPSLRRAERCEEIALRARTKPRLSVLFAVRSSEGAELAPAAFFLVAGSWMLDNEPQPNSKMRAHSENLAEGAELAPAAFFLVAGSWMLDNEPQPNSKMRAHSENLAEGAELAPA
eukprot:CAMPEP_0177744954 /NCGR_PEP_ID=MMETSP0484_2-20121128/30042_1 /TAXON_ID=354590 /ORGANISM="Rhodomonas lens, Strain RHODO" /LENGTH=126 /DNA_ID=CAMNT_0019259533 /DNA_START=298 /DNA_END=675 /DNA_ORIENTATION=+